MAGGSENHFPLLVFDLQLMGSGIDIHFDLTVLHPVVLHIQPIGQLYPMIFVALGNVPYSDGVFCDGHDGQVTFHAHHGLMGLHRIDAQQAQGYSQQPADGRLNSSFHIVRKGTKNLTIITHLSEKVR